MPSLSTHAVFLATAMALLAIPCPAVLYVVTRSIEMGRGGGIVVNLPDPKTIVFVFAFILQFVDPNPAMFGCRCSCSRASSAGSAAACSSASASRRRVWTPHRARQLLAVHPRFRLTFGGIAC
jgi:threonine/homoserine/homoserine lactone efflux protein